MTKILVVGLAVILAAAGSGRADSTTGQSGASATSGSAGSSGGGHSSGSAHSSGSGAVQQGAVSACAFKWERRCATGCGSAFEPKRECSGGPPISD